MYNISHKYKRFLFLLLKLAIVGIAFYFIYEKLANNPILTFSQLKLQFSNAFSTHIWTLVFLLILTDINWFLEILKWKILASVVQKITFLEAFKQSLASLTTAIITPNKIGEYGAKALYFEKNYRKKIVALNFVGNIAQLAVTVIFGSIGLVFFVTNFSSEIPTVNFKKAFFLLAVLTVIFLFRKILGLAKITQFFKNLSLKIYLQIIGLSFVRYLVFSHQFYFLLLAFGVETDYFTLINLIFCMYIIASFIPGLTIFDWVIKGSVALWIFNFIGLNELTLLTTTTLMWLFNFAIPALFGSVFVMNFNTEKE